MQPPSSNPDPISSNIRVLALVLVLDLHLVLINVPISYRIVPVSYRVVPVSYLEQCRTVIVMYRIVFEGSV